MANEARHSGTGQAAPDAEQAEDEKRMRRALGLGATRSGGAPGRPSANPVVVHRNGRSGEPPVNRIAEAQAALSAERLAREQAEAALRNAEAALKECETRRGHAELTRDEALAALAEERSARQALEEQLRELTAEPPAPPSEAAPVLPRRRGRPPKVRPAEAAPETDAAPVEWWVPGWKTRLPGGR